MKQSRKDRLAERNEKMRQQRIATEKQQAIISSQFEPINKQIVNKQREFSAIERELDFFKKYVEPSDEIIVYGRGTDIVVCISSDVEKSLSREIRRNVKHKKRDGKQIKGQLKVLHKMCKQVHENRFNTDIVCVGKMTIPSLEQCKKCGAFIYFKYSWSDPTGFDCSRICDCPDLL